MPRGRHRHSPPLHKLLPLSAIAGISLVCALGPWMFSQTAMLRSLAALAALTTVVGAFVMRRWDAQAGKQVADLTRARASDDWRHEERVAELETDLEESRELRTKLEQRLRAKRAELAGLRNEHASLLRRYATAETERASALEGRRLLEIESGPSAPALSAADTEEIEETEEAGAVAVPADAEDDASTTRDDAPDSPDAQDSLDVEPAAPTVFSPEGSKLFLRAKAALSRFDSGDDEAPAKTDGAVEAGKAAEAAGKPGKGEKPEQAAVGAGAGKAARADVAAKGKRAPEGVSAAAVPLAASPVAASGGAARGEGAVGSVDQEDDAEGQPVAADAHEHAAAANPGAQDRPAQPTAQPSGHFTVPTAVAVVPATPVRRPSVEGGFDFFGTQKGAPSESLDTVHNEDLADVVGQEALALHKGADEAEFKPADEASRGIGQVIDLTAHDETEQIDLQGLRTAAS
ncbi:hypothetical protein AB0F77_21160 [Streptomyces sp. NPDC026672]|uniref:hypothetical protein n=1 Tax=unclassified Streptomyces TaxID=2593676 RepID=UPI0033D6C542